MAKTNKGDLLVGIEHIISDIDIKDSFEIQKKKVQREIANIFDVPPLLLDKEEECGQDVVDINTVEVTEMGDNKRKFVKYELLTDSPRGAYVPESFRHGLTGHMLGSTGCVINRLLDEDSPRDMTIDSLNKEISTLKQEVNRLRNTEIELMNSNDDLTQRLENIERILEIKRYEMP